MRVSLTTPRVASYVGALCVVCVCLFLYSVAHSFVFIGVSVCILRVRNNVIHDNSNRRVGSLPGTSSDFFSMQFFLEQHFDSTVD